MNIQVNALYPLTTARINDGSSASGDQVGADSFQSQLTAALTATLEKFGVDPSKVSITIGPVTRNPGPTNVTPLPNSTAAAIAPPAGGTAQDPTISNRMMQQSLHWYGSDPVDDAYWAQQPPAVQQLREIQDLDARTALATQLAHEGYTIDVPIMVQGFDAGKTTALRKLFGYTWVPSALQDPIELAPGLAEFGTLKAYDPNNPPAGSILV